MLTKYYLCLEQVVQTQLSNRPASNWRVTFDDLIFGSVLKLKTDHIKPSRLDFKIRALKIKTESKPAMLLQLSHNSKKINKNTGQN